VEEIWRRWSWWWRVMLGEGEGVGEPALEWCVVAPKRMRSSPLLLLGCFSAPPGGPVGSSILMLRV
jgi:hypothetical protein